MKEWLTQIAFKARTHLSALICQNRRLISADSPLVFFNSKSARLHIIEKAHARNNFYYQLELPHFGPNSRCSIILLVGYLTSPTGNTEWSCSPQTRLKFKSSFFALFSVRLYTNLELPHFTQRPWFKRDNILDSSRQEHKDNINQSTSAMIQSDASHLLLIVGQPSN